MQSLLDTFFYWLDAHIPLTCEECSRIVLKKNMNLRQTTTGRRVYICDECDRDIFRPFSSRHEQPSQTIPRARKETR